ncbi:diaminopimelate decarboxylase [Candidatus Parcubacteria bacterium]|nr:diaminopimelate decarboxylase [Candidatus Parcubacteria bacterium]
MQDIEKLQFLSEDQVRQIAQGGTPVFVYSRSRLAKSARQALAFKVLYGLTVRYAMKANPHPEIIKLFAGLGLGIDASSGFEADVAIKAGVNPQKIQLTGQELPANLADLLKVGVGFTACSLHQLEEYGKLARGKEVGVRINPGAGAGMNNRLTTGGLAASFGIWYEYINQIHTIAKKYKLIINHLHTHAGTDTSSEGWLNVAKRNLGFLSQFPDAVSTSLGGGFKIARMSYEKSADLQEISIPIAKLLKEFYEQTGRKIHLEIEPGKFLVTNAGTLVTRVIDSKDTGKNGYNFLVIDGGMTEIIRPAMFGAQHPLVVVPRNERKSNEVTEYAVAGHCCESSDVLTVVPGDPETLQPRKLERAEIGDYLCVEGAGAYCASWSTVGYNSFPAAREIIID